MTRLLLLAAIVASLVGCGSDKLETTNNPTPPPPTKEQLANMPPEAAAHASQMSAYAKAQEEQNKARAPKAGP